LERKLEEKMIYDGPPVIHDCDLAKYIDRTDCDLWLQITVECIDLLTAHVSRPPYDTYHVIYRKIPAFKMAEFQDLIDCLIAAADGEYDDFGPWSEMDSRTKHEIGVILAEADSTKIIHLTEVEDCEFIEKKYALKKLLKKLPIMKFARCTNCLRWRQ